MNPLEAALRVMLGDILAAQSWQKWRSAGGGGQTAGGPPDLWNVPPGALIKLKTTVTWGLRNAGINIDEEAR